MSVKRKAILVLIAQVIFITNAFSQLSYQNSRPLRSSSTSVSSEQQLSNHFTFPPRFLGKYTAKGFSQPCGFACAAGPFASRGISGIAGHANATLDNTALSNFAFRPTLPAGQIPTAAAMGDFNGDGHLDWAIANGLDNTIWIYMGHGDGTSSLPTIIPTAGLAPVSLTAASLRGNGVIDLVVAEVDSNTVGVLLGNGDGTFQTEKQYLLPAPPDYVLVKDFTGDNKLDIAVGMLGTISTGPIAILPGDGQGNFGTPLFTPQTTAPNGTWLAAADLNGDGKQDLVIVDSIDVGIPPGSTQAGGAQVYLNNGNGTFTPGQLFFANQAFPNIPPQLGLSAALADLNGDGCNDAVLTDSYGLAYVFSGNCTGVLQTPPSSQYALGDIGDAIQLADLNGDGNLDIVTSGTAFEGDGGLGLGNVAANLVSVLLGDGTGHFSRAKVYRGEPLMPAIAVGDLNSDGFPDVVTANEGSNTASTFINDGKGGFGDPQGEAIGYGSGATNSVISRFLFADIDGNGTTDILTLQTPSLFPGPMEITTLLNDGKGNFSSPILSPSWTEDQFTPGDLVLADFRNTGRPDLLVVGFIDSGSDLLFAPNIGGGQFGPFTLTTPPGAGGLIAVGDFNGNGNLDFVTASVLTSPGDPVQLSIFLGNGDGTFKAGQTISFTAGTPSTIYTGDFNRDGKLDVLISANGVYEFLGNGDGTFQNPRTLFSSFGDFALADVNRDGWPDLVAMTDQEGNAVSLFSIPTITTFLGQPDGSFKSTQTYIPYLDSLRTPLLFGLQLGAPPPFEAVLGDFNGDGNPDVAVFQVPWQGQTQSFMQVLFGDGDGTFTPSYFSYGLNKPFVPQFAADVDGDGRSDLIELDNFTSSFNVVKSKASAAPVQLEILTTPSSGNTGYGRIVLNVPSTADTNILLTCNESAVVLPSVVVPAGSLSQDFQFSIGPGLNQTSVFSIQAQLGSFTATAYDYMSPVVTPVVELNPTAVLFGDVNDATNSNSEQVTLKNLGSATLQFTSISASSGYSETNNCGTSLASGASCSATVTSQGLLNLGGLNFGDNAGSGVQQVVLESFARGLQLTPSSLTFAQPIGSTSAPQTVVLTNQESIPLRINIAAPYPPGQGFSETNTCGMTLAPRASCNISVTFAPIEAQFQIASVAITDNSAFDNSYAFTVQGTGTDYSLTAVSSSATVTAGQTAAYALNANSLDGFTGAVNLSCTGVPSGAVCDVSPQSVNVPANAQTGFTVSVITTPRSTSGLFSAPGQLRQHRLNFLRSFAFAAMFLSIFSISSKRRWMLIIMAFYMLLLLCSCGGGGSSINSGGGNGGGTGGNTTGTFPGTYTFTVSGTAGGAQRTATLTLVVE